jgi:DNA-binding PadR family transcriptional regulator
MRDRLDRWADPPLLVLASLAEEPKHGYAITQDIADTMGCGCPPARSTR